jgi:rare lipoprotein A
MPWNQVGGAKTTPQWSAARTLLFVCVSSLALSSCVVRPVITALATHEGLASYYSYEFHGRKTANGETFDTHGYTAAHRQYPFGTKVRVTNLRNKQQVDVRINDRGPMKPERVIDLTLAAAKKIGLVEKGVERVRVEVVEWGKIPSSSTKPRANRS